MSLRKVATAPLFKRVVGTLLYGILFVWLVFTGGVPLFVGVTVITIIAAYEFYRMMTLGGHRPLYLIGIITAMIFVFDAYFDVDILRPGLTAAIISSLVWMGIEELRKQSSGTDSERNYLLDWCLTFAGAIYTGGILSHVVLLRSFATGGPLLATVVFGTAACDSGAYLIGTYFGRTKFFAHISPKKTWEGTIGGFLSSVVIVMLSATFFSIEKLHGLGLGILIGVSVIIGDLVESKIKRSVGVKDSGSWIPAQGGLLDVIDGFLFAIVVSYYYVAFVMRPA